MTTSCSAANSASAAGSRRSGSAAGHGATTTDSPPVSAVHSVSVTNGTIGCSSRSTVSSTWPSTRRVRSAASPPAASGTLASSTYQSQNSSQMKW